MRFSSLHPKRKMSYIVNTVVKSPEEIGMEASRLIKIVVGNHDMVMSIQDRLILSNQKENCDNWLQYFTQSLSRIVFNEECFSLPMVSRRRNQ